MGPTAGVCVAIGLPVRSWMVAAERSFAMRGPMQAPRSPRGLWGALACAADPRIGGGFSDIFELPGTRNAALHWGKLLLSDKRQVSTMDWIPALLKHLAITRSVVAAAFITSAVMYAGPRLAPAYVDPVPKEWGYVLLGTMVFSACLLCFWVGEAVLGSARRRWARTSAMLASHTLNPLEEEALFAMGERPGEAFDLDHLNYEQMRLSRLEVLHVMDTLRKKGLIAFNAYDRSLVSLTSAGRERALKIQRRANAAER